MARGFGTTYGTGTSDKIQTGYSTTQASNISVSIWCWINAFGGSNSGKLWNQGTLTEIGYSNFNFGLQLNGGAAWTWGVPYTGAWFHLCVVYTSGGTPVVYQNGSLVTPSGTANSTLATGNVYLGNISSGARNFDGMLAEAGYWNGSLLTASEARALSKGVSPRFIRPPSLSLYLPLFGAQSNEPDWGPSHVAQTITGTAKQNHAPVSFWMPTTALVAPAFYQGSLALAQGAATTAITAHEKFSASLAIAGGAPTAAITVSEKFHAAAALTQPNAAISIAGREKFSSILSLTAPTDLAFIYGHEIAANYPGRAAISDAAQGGFLALGDQPIYGLDLADTALYDVQIMESV